MTNTLPTTNLANISQFDNAFFYCINQASQRVPVGIIKNVSMLADNKLEFSLSHFPVLENMWNVFAAELFFYKKGISFNMTVHGTAWFADSNDDFKIQFKALYVESAGMPEVKQYSLHETLTDFFSNTGLFFKKMLVTGF